MKLIYLSLKTDFQEFFTHCCKKRTYFFEIKKCGEFNCEICGPIKSNPEIFNTLEGLPDPVPGNEGHYKEFLDIYGTSTTEEHCPSLLKKKQHNIPEKIVKKVGNVMGFSPRAQYAKNVRLLVRCSVCDKRRVLFAKRRLTETEYQLLSNILDDIEYVCGITFNDMCDLSSSKKTELLSPTNDDADEEINNRNLIDEDEDNTVIEEDDDDIHEQEEKEQSDNVNDPIEKLFQLVFVNAKHTCNSQIETTYFSAGIYPNICCKCGEEEDMMQEDLCLPYCRICEIEITANHKKEQKRKRGKRNFINETNAKK